MAWISGGIQASVLLVQADEAGEGDNGDHADRKTAPKRKSIAIGLPLLVENDFTVSLLVVNSNAKTDRLQY